MKRKVASRTAILKLKDLDAAMICVVGLGYVGYPLAEAFSRTLPVIGFEINSAKVRQLRQKAPKGLMVTDDPARIAEADFAIICVPTPVTKSKQPDLSFVEGAARTIGSHMKRGCVVVLESTVYPGVTEDVVKPILEQESGLVCGTDFKVGYSPERINPGDTEHTIDRITKVVSGMDAETTELLAGLYGKVARDVHQAPDIKTAEAAKVIENVQRDLNIALMNELSMIFEKIGVSTRDVLAAASTKWNFHAYRPGLVGGHCIPVDPYYLIYKANVLGYHPQVISAGRSINDNMAAHVAVMVIKALNRAGKVIQGSKVLVMGLTYKENVPDTRETPVREMVKELQEYGVEVYGHDPLLEAGDIERYFAVKCLPSLKGAIKFDAVVVTAAHSSFRSLGKPQMRALMGPAPVLVDIPGLFAQKNLGSGGIEYLTL